MFRTHLSAVLLGVACLGVSLLIWGCLGGEGGTAISVVQNLSRDKSYLRVSLDGKEAKQNTILKAAVGHSNWDIKDPVDSDHPKFSYKITKPEKFGRITYTVISITQEFQGHYSDQAEFIVTPKSNDFADLIKENIVYDLGNPPKNLKVFDVASRQVKGVKLVPGKKYQLQLTVKADHSETANLYFKSK
jgi:hypothetical protein